MTWVRPVLMVMLVALTLRPSLAQDAKTIEDATAGMEESSGYFTFFWDAKEGKIWLQIERLDEDFLWVNALATGLGSNPVGLDRTQPGDARVVRFQRIGPQILLVQRNLEYRAVTDEEAEKRAVEESFAHSVLWGGRVAAESEGKLLVDLSSFLLSDAHNVIGTLRRSDQGSFQLDASRSAIYLPRTRSFPKNTEFEVSLTFTSSRPGGLVREVAPSPDSITLRQHHSFVELPDDGYQPRRFDPRAGGFGLNYADYATPLDQPLRKRFIARHRLHKKDPSAAVSEAVEPIVYYLDPGAPEPVRSALLDGARWWNQAFEAAGYRDAFRVEILPEDADPLDVRYNVIQWVHRSTRGWSYGNTITDPRTGEIIKGHVQLGSLRVRQDRMLIEGLGPIFAENGMGECAAGSGGEATYLASFDPDISPVEVSLARIRQLSAHEVGHTIGFSHNFASSTYGGRASVMDYPAPLAKVNEDGSLDLSDAYGVGIGDWDKFTVRYAYSDFPPGTDESEALGALIGEAVDNGWLFVTDADARPPGAAHPLANLWDNGADPLQGLHQTMRVRSLALERFGPANLHPGQPLSELEKTLVPLYLHHRYQVEGAAKLVGGAYYYYKFRNDDLPIQQPVSADLQRQALQAVLGTVDPKALLLSPEILRWIHPPAHGYRDSRESFESRTSPWFDPLTTAMTAARISISPLLQYERAGRLELFHSQDPSNPDLGEVIDAVMAATWKADTPESPSEAAVARVVENVVLERLIDLAGHPRAAPDVRAIASLKLAEMLNVWQATIELGGAEGAHAREAVRRAVAFLQRAHPESGEAPLPNLPPGSPIGSDW